MVCVIPSVPAAVTPPHQPDHDEKMSLHSTALPEDRPGRAISAADVLPPKISFFVPESILFYSNSPGEKKN